MRRLLLVPLLLALAACSKETPPNGAVRLTVSYPGFKPVCVQVSARDAGDASRSNATALAGKGDTPETRSLTVAIFREPTWSRSVEVTAEVYDTLSVVDQKNTCTGTLLARQSRGLTVADGQVLEETLALAATDADADGHLVGADVVAAADCVDSDKAVHPGAQEVCNGRDDNCGNGTDEGFEVGALCDSASSCQGAWACNATGGRTCQARPNQWYPDADGDGHGARDGTPQDGCQQPAGHAPNNGDCDDTTAARHPGATERCNSVDEDCDGDPLNGLGVGTECSQGVCTGSKVCAADGSVTCDAPTPFTRFRDADSDGYGAKDTQPVTLCQPTPGYSTTSDDCDDTTSARHPGAAERCTSVDEDCDGDPYNGLDLGAVCTPTSGCGGELACDAAGDVICQATSQPGTWYPDEDLDLRGKQGAGVSACTAPAGHVATGNDCDDGDPFTYAGATELCDGKDNDCNNQLEGTGVCPAAGAAWTAYNTGTNQWNKLSLWGPGNANVWAVGMAGTRAVKEAQQSSFTLYTNNCSGDWYSVWADPSTGRAYLGGTSDALGIQDVGSGSCTSKPPAAKEDTLGLMGFRAGNGSVSLYGVGAKPDRTGGWAFTWDGSANPQPYTEIQQDAFYDVHGLSADLLFAVGGPASPNEPRIYRFNRQNGQWVKEANVPTANLDRLNDVWVVHSKLAYAVGEGGSILRWDGATWHKQDFNNGGTSFLTGVLAFGTNALYVTTASGAVYLYNGTSWQLLHDIGSRAATDIAGASPEDLWVTGQDGRIVHWPK